MRYQIIRLGLLAYLLTPVVFSSQVPQSEARKQAIERFKTLSAEGKIAEARQALVDMIEQGNGTPDDVAVLGRTFVATGDLEIAVSWFARGMQLARGKENTTHENIAFLLGRTLWELGRKKEAIPDLAVAGRHHTFESSSEFNAADALSEKWADGRERFVEYAQALEGAGMAEAAVPYRKVAAAGTFKAGLWAIRTNHNQECLEYFAEAEQILPLDRFPTEVRMTVLRDMVMAYGRMGRLLQGSAALDRLFKLCTPENGSWSCPVDGVASAPFSGSQSGIEVLIDGKPLNLHLKILTKLAERTFMSVSWDPATLALRGDSRNEEFLGAATESEIKTQDTTNQDDPTADCVVSGTPYARSTGSEEDRVEFERCWSSWRASSVLQQRLSSELAAKHYRLIVKGLLSEIELGSRVGMIAAIQTQPDRTVAGVPFADLRKKIAECDDEPTQTAFEVAEQLLSIIGRASHWPLTD